MDSAERLIRHTLAKNIVIVRSAAAPTFLNRTMNYSYLANLLSLIQIYFEMLTDRLSLVPAHSSPLEGR